MPVFEYEVVDKKGTLGRGRAEAEDQTDLIQRFRERGQLVVSLRPALPGVQASQPRSSVGLGSLAEAFRLSFKRMTSGVPLAALVLFTGQLAAMLDAGIHLVRILTAIARESTNRKFSDVLDDVRGSVTAGSTFAEALGRHPNVFSRLYVAVVRSGEQSGSLPIVLHTLTTHLEKSENLRRKVKGAIAYPLVILVTSILIVFVMLVKIVPVFEDVYARAKAQLPRPTLILISVSSFLRDYTLLAVLLLIVLAIAGYMILQTSPGRLALDSFALRVPIFGSLIRKSIMARVTRTLSLLLQSGIPLIDALETIAQVTGNRVVERALLTSTQHVRDGATLADTLRQTGQFPSMVTQLVASGEESGTLPSMLGKAAVYYEQQVDTAVATLSTLIEPIMIVLMGAIAGSVIVALYMPIFNLGQVIKGGMR
jgi:type IV pilus assembly protein PilC